LKARLEFPSCAVHSAEHIGRAKMIAFIRAKLDDVSRVKFGN
jgi:hypothetical protein